MEWNLKSPLQWEGENQGLYSGRESEICFVKPGQPVGWRAKGGVTIGNGSVYSSELGNGSSKSSMSASMDSSLKAGGKISGFNFDDVDGFPKNLNKNKELARMEDTGTSPAGEPLTCLKLGKRTYFEDVCAGNNVKNSTSSTSPAPSAVSVKKTRISHQSILNSRCQVEGCNIDLSGAKDYHRKHRVCESHSKCPRVVVAGQERRFCQQCSRFHDLTEFDQKKRSCRRRLSDHNARRRKPQTDTVSFSSSRFSPAFYDDRQQQQMNFLLTGGTFGSVRPTTGGTWEDSGGFSLTHTKGSWAKSTKAGGIDGQLHFSGPDLVNTVPTLPHDLDKLLPFKGSTAEVLNQGIEASVPASNLEGAPDFRRALSLLSTTDSWGSVNPSQSNLAHLMVNTSLDGAVHVHAVNDSTSGYWQDQQQTTLPHQTQALPFDLHINHNNGNSQLQDFQLSKATTYETSFFNSGQMIAKPDGNFLEFKT